MSIKRKSFAAAPSALADQRQVRVVCSTGEIDRDGEMMVQAGIDLTAYRGNPVVLWQHDPCAPIARCLEIGPVEDRTEALVQFPDPGVSAKADEIYGLILAGVVNGVSIGVDPLQIEPMDPARPLGPVRYMRTELCEFSFVSIPAVRGAGVVARSAGGHPRAAAKVAAGLVRKSLYDVGSLAYLVSELGWMQQSTAFEAEQEGDGSQVPAMLGEALQQLGAALVAMTAEEVAELLAAAGVAPTPVVAPDDAAYVEAAATPQMRAFRAGWAAIRRARGAAPTTAATIAKTRRQRMAEAIAAIA